MSKKTHTILVLSDGQTWNTIGGCSICVISDEDFNDLCEDRIDAKDIHPIAEIGLDSIAN
jgi:bifunctional pyridoxal-dependent enzyme with beta-cystathionase and maltose regulon repressor activities